MRKSCEGKVPSTAAPLNHSVFWNPGPDHSGRQGPSVNDHLKLTRNVLAESPSTISESSS